MHCKKVVLLVVVITVIVSADETNETRIENGTKDYYDLPDEEGQGIYPRQDKNPLKGLGQKFQGGAQNLIKGVQHFVVGVLGAINNVNVQNEISDAFQASEETTTSEYYDEDTTTMATPTTTNTIPPSVSTTIIPTTVEIKSAESSPRPGIGYKIINAKTTTAPPPNNNNNQTPLLPVIQQFQLLPQHPQFQGQYLSPLIPAYPPQFQPALISAYQQLLNATNAQLPGLVGGYPNNNIPSPVSTPPPATLSPAIQQQIQSLVHKLINPSPPPVAIVAPIQSSALQLQQVPQPASLAVQESAPQNEQPLKSSSSSADNDNVIPEVIQPPQNPEILSIIHNNVPSQPPPPVQQQVVPIAVQIVTSSEAAIPAVVSSSSTKPLNRLQQFSLNRKPIASQILALKPTNQLMNNKAVNVPLGTVIRPANEQKYPIKPPNSVRTWKPLFIPSGAVHKPVASVVPQPLPQIIRLPEFPVTEEDTTIIIAAAATTEEGEEKEVTEEAESGIDPEVESVQADTQKVKSN